MDSLTVDLESRLRLALAALNVDALFAYLDFTIQERTRRGEFLEGSTPGAERYHDPAHIRAREKLGLPTGRVDLRFKPPHMLDSMKGRTETFEGGVRAEFGYLDGLSEAEASKLAAYHHTGGSAGDIRRFVGLTDEEEAKLLDLITRDLLSNL